MSYNSDSLVMTERDLKRFYSFCEVDLVTGCWNWTGGKHESGSGKFWMIEADVQVQAYRVAYNTFVGPVLPGMELAHRYNPVLQDYCRCAFWEHVRQLTHSQNMMETRGGTVELCPHGHDRRWGKSKSGGCNVCQWIRNRLRLGIQPCMNCGRVVNRCRCNELDGLVVQ